MLRYQRQILLPQIGRVGQERLAASRALLVGCGALGCTIAEQIVRAGVGFLRIVDRDVVEWTNLQRQTLYTEQDAREGLPKVIAAANRLRAVNSEVSVDPVVADVHAGNIEELSGVSGALSVVLDGTDNVQTRYLINDYAVRNAVPWVYGGCVGTEGRVMAIRPPHTACFRCIFPDPPAPGDLPTCDTAGVLGPAATVTAAIQGAEAIRLLVGGTDGQRLITFDLWECRFHRIDTSTAKRPDCPCCGLRRFDFLDNPTASATVSLCGRNAVQVCPAMPVRLDLSELAGRLATSGDAQLTPYLVRCRLAEPAGLSLTVFADGRVVVTGTSDAARARSLVARFVGA